MVLGTAVDSNVLSYPVLIIMKDQGAVVGEAELALSRRARQSLPLDVGRGGV